jgi:hypothetical protein
MLEMEVELQLLFTSIFDKLPRSESGNVSTAFNMYAAIQRDCSKDMYPSNAFLCVILTCYSGVNTLHLFKRCSIKNNLLWLDGNYYVSLRELLTFLLGMNYEMDTISPLEDFTKITKKCPITRLTHTRRALIIIYGTQQNIQWKRTIEMRLGV